MLASDMNNPEFSGAIPNPDSLLHVEFYWHEPIDKWGSEEASAKAGRRVTKKLEKTPYVRIMKPGDQTSILEVAVREEHKARWPERWMYWQMSEGLLDETVNIPGWRVDEWPYLDQQPDLLRELKHMRFHTVELIAGASDAQVQRIGMAGQGIREQARAALRNKLAGELREEAEKKDAEIAKLKAAKDEMEARMAKMEAMLAEPKRRGRKPKEVVNG